MIKDLIKRNTPFAVIRYKKGMANFQQVNYFYDLVYLDGVMIKIINIDRTQKQHFDLKKHLFKLVVESDGSKVWEFNNFKDELSENQKEDFLIQIEKQS